MRMEAWWNDSGPMARRHGDGVDEVGLLMEGIAADPQPLASIVPWYALAPALGCSIANGQRGQLSAGPLGSRGSGCTSSV